MESINQGIPFEGNPNPFSSWEDIGAPHMATLSFWESQLGCQYGYSQPLSSKILELLQNQISSQLILELTLLLLLPLFRPPFFLFSGENSDVHNQETEKKKKKSVKQWNNHESSGENSCTKSPRYPCVICRGNHYH